MGDIDKANPPKLLNSKVETFAWNAADSASLTVSTFLSYY